MIRGLLHAYRRRYSSRVGTRTTALRPSPVAVAALASAVVGVASLFAYRALWIESAGSPAALDANEAIATIAWLGGWVLVAGAGLAGLILLATLVRRLVRWQSRWMDAAVLVATAVLIAGAWLVAPLWGIGAGVA